MRSCLVVCMDGSFECIDTWVPAPCLNQAILYGEGSGNWEDEVVRDGGGQMNERIQAKGARRVTKHTAWTRSDIKTVRGRPNSAYQSRPIWMNEFTNFLFLYHFVSFSFQRKGGRGEATNSEQIFFGSCLGTSFSLCTKKKKSELDLSKAKFMFSELLHAVFHQKRCKSRVPTRAPC